MRGTVFAGLALASLAAAQNFTPSNISTWQPYPTYNGRVLLTNNHINETQNLVPLTLEAYDALHPNDTNAVPSPDDSGYMYVATPDNSNNFSRGMIAYVSCDPETYADGMIDLPHVVTNLASHEVTAIILYSIYSNFCNLTVTGDGSNYTNFFSMSNARVSRSLLGTFSNQIGEQDDITDRTICTQIALNNAANNTNTLAGLAGGSSSTAVAMIVLYSITGLITALFLIIIVTGAIRAHRHPERYGPRRGVGRPRQSRAKGLARAMLDTLPIVKFGQDTAEPTAVTSGPKPTDIELAESASTTRQASAAGQNIHPLVEKQPGAAYEVEKAPSATSDSPREANGESSTATTPAAIATHDPHNPSVPTAARPSEGPDEGLGCSICTDDFERGQDIRVLPCNHKFHPACVDPWLLDVSGTCPLCRIDLRPQQSRDDDENADGEGRASGSDARNDDDLPPPMDPSVQRRGTLRGMLVEFANRRALMYASPEERIAALRRWRERETRRARNSRAQTSRSMSSGGPTDAEVEEETRRFRTLVQEMQARGGKLRQAPLPTLSTGPDLYVGPNNTVGLFPFF